MPRSRWIWLPGVASLFGAAAAVAQTFPVKPVRIVIGLRRAGHRLTGQQTIGDNQPGAGSNIASEIVARARDWRSRLR